MLHYKTLSVYKRDFYSHVFANPVRYISNRFFENQPNEFCSRLSEKGSKGRFLKLEKLQNRSNEGKGKEKKKEPGEGKEEKKKSNGYICTLSKKKLSEAKGPFADNVIKNPA